jgi:glycosyltransferase 2 family protein
MTNAKHFTHWLEIIRSRFQQKTLRRTLFVTMIVVGSLFIGYALWKTWNDIHTGHIQINYLYIALAILIYPFGMLPTVAGWHILLNSLGVKLRWRIDLRIYSLSSLPRHIPGFVWYIASRSMLYQEIGIPTTTITAASGIEVILLALTGYALSIPLLLATSAKANNLQLFAPIAIIILVILVAWVPFNNRILQKMFAWRRISPFPKIDQGKLIIALLWMVAGWFGGSLILFVLTASLYPVDLSLLPMFIGAWGLAGAVSLTIGIGIQGFGIREVTLAATLSLFFPPPIAVVLAVLFRLVLTIGELLWVALFVWVTRKPLANLEN